MATRRALIIASDQFADPKLSRLRSPGADARALARVLGDPAIGDFEVSLSFNETESVVRRRLSRFLIDSARDDLLVLHMACHGVKDEDGNLHFATTDTDTGDLYATAVDADFVQRLMARSPSRRIVLLLDCCYSGAFSRGMQVRGDPEVHVLEQFTGRGRAVLTASSAMEYAWESDDVSGKGQASVFTSAILRGLESGEADRDGDGQISVDELYDYVLESVRQVTPNQTPNKQIQVEGDLFLAKSVRGARPVLARLPPEVLEAARSPLAGVREGAVLELARLRRSDDPGQARAAETVLSELVNDDSRRVSTAAVAAQGHQQMQAPIDDTPPRSGSEEPASTRSSPVLVTPGARVWWGIGLRGAAALLAGIVLMVQLPSSMFIGTLVAYGLVHSILELASDRTRTELWVWRAAEGLICLVLSVVVVWVSTNPDLETDPTPELVWLALFCLTIGAGDFVEAWRARDHILDARVLALSGVAFTVFGAVVTFGISGLVDLSSDEIPTRLTVIGGLASVCGVALLMLAWWLRSALSRVMPARTA